LFAVENQTNIIIEILVNNPEGEMERQLYRKLIYYYNKEIQTKNE